MSVWGDEPQARDCEDTASQQYPVSDWHYFSSGNETVGLNVSPGFLTESFTEMLGSFILPENNQGTIPTYPPDSAISNGQQVCANNKQKKKKSMEDCTASVPSSSPIKHTMTERDVDVLPDVVLTTMMVNAEKKERGKVKVSANSAQSLDAKDVQSPARAKRGQATSSHSLAERVRRERISERMRLLQDLVPGCNKITGKAVMLDEIINYVQALQKQVEFLAMKLAAVRPEINVDLEQIIASRYGNLVVPMYSPGIHISQACSTPVIMQAGMPHSVTPNPDVLLRAATSGLSTMNQTHTLSDYDLQHILQLGSMSTLPQESIKNDEAMKVEP